VGRLIPLAALGALLVVAVGACGSSGATTQWWHVDDDPFRITVLGADGAVVREAAEPARLRYQLTDGTQHALTKVVRHTGGTYVVATNERGRTAAVRLTHRSVGVRISVSFTPAKGVAAVYDAFAAAPAEHFMGGGERGDTLDLRGQIVPLRVSYQCNEAPAPFFQSSRGYAVRIASGAVGALAFPGSAGGPGCTPGGTPPTCTFPPLKDRTEVCVTGSTLVEDVYLGSLARTQRAYVADVGRPAVPPLSQYALMKWRDEVTSQTQLDEDVSNLRAAGVPVGWVILDNPWETCVGTLKWDPSVFPDPKATIARLHAQHVKLMLWVSPDVFCADGAGYPRSALVPLPHGWAIDLANPRARAIFRSRLASAFAAGVDGAKGDRADEASMPNGNEYPLLFQRDVVAALAARRGGDWATIFRAASPASAHVVHGFWNGDQPGDFVGLQRAIHQALSAGVAGMSVWGSDVGGYASAGLTPEVFARWTALGAVSPVLEVGGVGPNATPWTLGPTAMSALAEAARVHYALVPLFDSLVRAGWPVLRPLAYGFPRDPRAWAADLELLVGPDLLAAPVIGPGTTPSVYLPAGRWVDLYTGATVAGGRAFTRPTPLDRFPFYARAGAVVPFALRTAHDPLWQAGELSHRGRAGYLATNGSRLDLRRQPGTVQVFVPAPVRPRRVLLDGRPLPFTWESGPMPGAVLRLRGPVVRGRISIGAA
jgi:alpha-D-xyloside xylohydrolase